MSTGRRSFHKLFPTLGIVLLGIGLTALLVQTDRAANELAERFGANAGEVGGTVPAAILTTIRAAQALAFDRANVVSATREMLLSCWPVILVILGAALLRSAFNGLASLNRTAATAAEGEN
jgi:hypothetical protein